MDSWRNAKKLYRLGCKEEESAVKSGWWVDVDERVEVDKEDKQRGERGLSALSITSPASAYRSDTFRVIPVVHPSFVFIDEWQRPFHIREFTVVGVPRYKHIECTTCQVFSTSLASVDQISKDEIIQGRTGRQTFMLHSMLWHLYT